MSAPRRRGPRGAPLERAGGAPDPETPSPLSGAGFFPSHPAFTGRPCVASSVPTTRTPPADARRRLPSDVGCRTWRGRKRVLRAGDGSFQGLASGEPLCPHTYLDQDTVGMAYYQESSPAYCKNCGHRLGMESNFCSSCGCSLREEGGYGRPLYVLTDKNVGIAVLLSLLIVGAGHMYVGKVAAGAVWFIGLSIITLACCFLAAGIYSFQSCSFPFSCMFTQPMTPTSWLKGTTSPSAPRAGSPGDRGPRDRKRPEAGLGHPAPRSDLCFETLGRRPRNPPQPPSPSRGVHR